MSVTFADLIEEVRENVGESDSNKTRFTDKFIARRLNNALKRNAKSIAKLQGEYYFTEQTITPSAEAASLQLPNGTLYDAIPECNGQIDSVFVNDGKLRHGSLFMKVLPQENVSPSCYLIRGDYIVFDGYVTTSDEVKLRYYTRPATASLTGSFTETVDFPEDHMEVLVLAATIMCHMKDKNVEMVNEVRKQMSYAVKEMIKDVGSSRSNESLQGAAWDNDDIYIGVDASNKT